MCKHERISIGAVFEYCKDCGAVKRKDTYDKTRDNWHSCKLCLLGGANGPKA